MNISFVFIICFYFGHMELAITICLRVIDLDFVDLQSMLVSCVFLIIGRLKPVHPFHFGLRLFDDVKL